jgi:hypothetical protein
MSGEAGAAVASYGDIHAFTFQNPLRENPILDQAIVAHVRAKLTLDAGCGSAVHKGTDAGKTRACPAPFVKYLD